MGAVHAIDGRQPITWLASYPKSGNTWMRVFLTNLRRGGDAPANINDLDTTVTASARDVFDRLVGYDTANLTPEEIDALRPDVYTHLAAGTDEPLLCKIHDAYTRLADGRPAFPVADTGVAVYLVRNPLDVAVSLAHHNQMAGIDPAIDFMGDPDATLAARPRAGALRQRLLSWSGHVRSWTDAPDLALQVVRYEDLVSRPVETFAAVAARLGLTRDLEAVRRALAFSAIEELQRQEREHGFREASARETSFFRQGGAGGWRDVLSEAQAARIIRDHHEVMRRFDYLSLDGTPLA